MPDYVEGVGVNSLMKFNDGVIETETIFRNIDTHLVVITMESHITDSLYKKESLRTFN